MSDRSPSSEAPAGTPSHLLRLLSERISQLAERGAATSAELSELRTGVEALAAAADPGNAEEALLQSETRYRSVVEGVVEGIVIHQDGQIKLVNQALVRLHGYDRAEELLGKHPDILIAPECLEMLRDRRRLAFATGTVLPEVEWQGLRRDGSRVWCQSRVTPFTWEGRPAILSTRVDISERKRLEERLRQAQKMEAVGRLAGGIAHEFNNLLTVINGYAELLAMDAAAPATHRPMLRGIQQSGLRAAELTRQLLAFSRRQMLQAVPLNLNALLTELAPTLRRALGDDITLNIRIASELGKVKADRTQLEQVIVNLAVNAREAMPAGGVFVLETASVVLDDADIRDRPETTPGAYARLTVADTGGGMDAGTRARIFEPFFTTKEFGKGSGLGLAMAYGIVKQSGGHLEVDSEPGCGTTFRIFLPLCYEDAPRVRSACSEAEEVVDAGGL